MRNALDTLFLTVITIVGMFVIATSIPLGSPHIYAYCLMSQFGTVPVDSDAFRVFCLKGPDVPGNTGSVKGTEEALDDLKDIQNYDRFLPYFYESDRSEGGPQSK